MSVSGPQRIALHRAAANSWGTEVADTLIESVAPAGQKLATRDIVVSMLTVVVVIAGIALGLR